MLHLAQVSKQDPVNGVELQLLAKQKSETTWAVLPEEITVSVNSSASSSLAQGLLVLVDLSEQLELLSVREVTGWLLDLIQTYLTNGITPSFLQQEADRAEQWRQSLTLESQELGRRALELEARREQIEALEANLKQDKDQLEEMAAQLEIRREQVEALEANLKEMAAQFGQLQDSKSEP